jgi:hypothetical protein
VCEITLSEVKERYCSDLANRIAEQIEYAKEKGMQWKLEVFNEDDYFISFVFVTKAFTWYYEFHKGAKKVSKEWIIGSVDCEKILNLMKSLRMGEAV